MQKRFQDLFWGQESALYKHATAQSDSTTGDGFFLICCKV